ncbi:LysR family transcriptional regulator [Sphingomonas sediminicola]|uniref:LysR family transcriptional regulator n=1 Tax=Sphingomonas sediminicola TaxID=386874 RepID=A0ABX6T6R1_9SPHN|nr:LysR family transcriptional regulator [Sphingomonas sediminicola]QNP45547.1 LysR family transcriptional regulator [Sphingomonas sediminicola]
MSRMGLFGLQAVLAIARRGSFRSAALELNVSTTALSNAVAKLERELGVRLFNRTTRSVSLTDAGRSFVDQVGPALQDIGDAMNIARSHQEVPSGTIRINSFPTAAREAVMPLVLQFLERYPQVHVDIVTEGRLVDIVGEGFDLGVRAADLVPHDMIAVPLQSARRHVVVGTPAYLQAAGVPEVPSALSQHRCICIRLPNGAPYPWQFEKDGKTVKINVGGPLTLDEASLARMAVLSHVGLGYFMEADVREDIEKGRFVEVLGDWALNVPPLCLYYPSRRNPSAAFRALVELAREINSQV